MCVCACAEASRAFVLVCADKLKIINNHVNEKEKEGEHRVAGTENHFVLVIFQFWKANAILRYMRFECCCWCCVVCCFCCLKEPLFSTFSLSLSLRVCFCCFSFAVETRPNEWQAGSNNNSSVASDGLEISSFSLIPCVHYHIFRFSSWWIFDACRHCAVPAVRL